MRNKRWLLMVMMMGGLLGCEPTQESRQAPLESPTPQSIPSIPGWPPQLSKPFPELEFIDERGQSVTLSSFGGYVLLVEFVRMPESMLAPKSESVDQDPNGSNRNNTQESNNSKSMSNRSPREWFSEHAGLKPEDHRIIHVQILIYGPANEQPKERHIELWTDKNPTEVVPKPKVFVPKSDLRLDATDKLIGGYLLLDKDAIVQFNAAGPRPKHDLFTELLPALADYAARLSNPEGKYSLEWSTSETEGELGTEKKDKYLKNMKPLRQ